MATIQYARKRSQGLGGSQAAINYYNPDNIVANRAPVNGATGDKAEIGTQWVDAVNQAVYVYVGGGVWTTAPASGTGVFTSLSVTPGNADIAAGDLSVTLGDFSVGGNSVLTGDLTVNGTTTINGDFDISSASALSFTTTSNTDPAISFTTNGGAAETIILTNTQGTAVDAIDLESVAGGVKIFAGGAALSIQGNNQAVDITSGTGTIGLGADLVAHTINIGNATGATAVSITSGTGSVNLASTGTGDIIINSDDTLLLDADGVLELNSSAGVISIGNDADAQNINIGTGAAARVITIGNVTGASQVVLNSGTAGVAINTTGTGDFVVTSADTALIDSAGVLELNSSAGAISIGNDAVAQAINVGTGAAARTITIGNISGATAVNVNSGTGGFNVVSTGTGDITLASADTVLIDSAGVLELNSSAGVIGIGNDAVAQNINVGTGAAARTITVGNVSGATAVNVNTGTGGFSVATTGAGVATITSSAATVDALRLVGGGLRVAPVVSASGASPRTASSRFGVALFTDNVAAAATVALAITNTVSTATSRVMATVQCATAGSACVIRNIDVSVAGTITCNVTNLGGTDTTGNDVAITFWVMST